MSAKRRVPCANCKCDVIKRRRSGRYGYSQSMKWYHVELHYIRVSHRTCDAHKCDKPKPKKVNYSEIMVASYKI